MSNHGKPLSNGDQAFLTSRLVTAVPDAMRDLDAQEVIREIKGGIKLDECLNQLFKRLLAGYEVTVVPNLSYEARVKLGGYDEVDEKLVSLFDYMDQRAPVSDPQKVRIKLATYDCSMSHSAIHFDLRSRRMRRVTPEEFLALGAQYPDLQRQYKMVCLAWEYSFPGGMPWCASLMGNETKRALNTTFCSGPFPASYRFPAVQET